jgi:hypothetical protein
LKGFEAGPPRTEQRTEGLKAHRFRFQILPMSS